MLMFGQQAGLTVADPEGEYVAVQLLRWGNVPDDIAKKVTFEDQISPTFRRSKELLAEIGERSHAVRAA